MDKILEFRKGPLWDEDSKVYRFQCDCTSPGDAMDITVDSWGKESEDKAFTISMYFTGTSFWDRIKYAINILKKRWCWREFVVRNDDLATISGIFDPNKKYSELP